VAGSDTPGHFNLNLACKKKLKIICSQIVPKQITFSFLKNAQWKCSIKMLNDGLKAQKREERRKKDCDYNGQISSTLNHPGQNA